MKDNNYIVIQGWMVNHFPLKSNELLTYGLIFGYCQWKEDVWFDFPLSYIQKSIGASKNTVLRSLEKLIELNCIKKQVFTIHNVKLVKYRHTDIEELKHQFQKETTPSAKTEPGGSAKTEHNNTIINKPISNTLFSEKEEIKSIPESVIDYLNEKLKSKRGFQKTNSNLGLIKTRIKEGARFEDFKKVIDLKYDEWIGQEKTKVWLRPSTLFGNKFDSYIVQAEAKAVSNDGSDNFVFNPTSLKDAML